MAKDGTARGGQRVGAGRKPKALADKVTQGSAANVLDFHVPEDLEGADVSAAVGYATISSFYRTFAAYYGCTPGEYSASDTRAE